MIRIVKMEFDPEQVETFQQLFDARKERIARFSGCQGVQLLQDISEPNIFFTYSHWESPAHLEQYRQSDLFKETWRLTKALFAGKPAAWSVEVANQA